MEYQAFQDEVFGAAREAGLTDYELYYSGSESTEAGAFQHEINQFASGVSGGACFRCVVEGKMGYASTEDLSPEEARSLVERAVECARSLESDEPALLCPGGQHYEALELRPYGLPDTEELLDTVLKTQDKLYAADSAVVDGCGVTGYAQRVRVDIANSRGLDLHYANNVCALVVAAVVSGGGEMSSDYQIKAGELEKLDADALVRRAVDAALAKLGGESAPTGVCPVVFSPDAMASLLQTFSGIFSAERAQKGLSRLGDKEGAAIAAPGVTLVDDPFRPDAVLPIPFDAEGCPTRRKNVIEGGTLRTLLYNLKAAHQAGRETTGNASKADFSSPVGIRPFSFYFLPGSCTEAELLERAGEGVYINFLGGLHAGANPVTGDFSLQSAGFRIQGGRKTTPVKDFTVAGNFYDLLKQITALADDLRFPGETGITCFGSPSVLVEGLSVAGK